MAHIINTWEDNINANSVGRLDKILYPYYAADIQKGNLTKAQAFELLCCLWIKLYRDYDVQQSCLGGTNPDGSSMVNELSYYTGIIFQGFVLGLGTPILSGGRYDHLVEQFGEATPATGFSVHINYLLEALSMAKGREGRDS